MLDDVSVLLTDSEFLLSSSQLGQGEDIGVSIFQLDLEHPMPLMSLRVWARAPEPRRYPAVLNCLGEHGQRRSGFLRGVTVPCSKMESQPLKISVSGFRGLVVAERSLGLHPDDESAGVAFRLLPNGEAGFPARQILEDLG